MPLFGVQTILVEQRFVVTAILYVGNDRFDLAIKDYELGACPKAWAAVGSLANQPGRDSQQAPFVVKDPSSSVTVRHPG